MNVTSDSYIPDVKIIDHDTHYDDRGYFLETYNSAKTHLPSFVQDNLSYSVAGTLRGIHYQLERPQGKLVRVITGKVMDVVVDLRKSSTTFGKHVVYVLSEENKKAVYVPPGFGHAFLALEDSHFAYKVTAHYYKKGDRTIRYNDPQINIAWPAVDENLLSQKDKEAPYLKDAEVYK